MREYQKDKKRKNQYINKEVPNALCGNSFILTWYFFFEHDVCMMCVCVDTCVTYVLVYLHVCDMYDWCVCTCV
jgi:hypothetical protein